ncbi:MAG: helix-turn-helix domain-containing protein [Candidatus Omnitrophica bacterium]|nr:helix-turn-helix domain-containing protein [Candidatus Omnitrophota bacterium]
MEKTIFTKAHKYLVKQLVTARRKTGLRQDEVAKKLGRTQSYLSKIESGERRIDVVQLKEFAAVYKKKLDFFIK